MKNIIKKLLVLGLALFALPAIASPQDVELDKIVVTPSRVEESTGDVSRNVDVVTSGEIEKGGAQNLADVLTNLTSVDISNYGGPGVNKNIRMRGSTAAQVLVMVDGRPINNPRDGQVDLSSISLDDISRVEVMHGPGSSIYGSSAMGGVVNIITKNPPKQGQKTELYSSFGTRRTYIERMSQGAKISNFSYLIGGEYQSSAGFRANSEFDSKDINSKLEYALGDNNKLSFNSGFHRSMVGAPGSTAVPDIDDKQRNIKNYQDFNWDLKPDETTAVSMKAYQNYDRLEFMGNSADSAFEFLDNVKDIHTTIARGLNLQLDKQLLDRYRIIGGFNYVKNMNDSTSSAKHNYHVNAGYLQNHLDLSKNLKINFGARIDDYSNFGTQVNPNFDFLYNFNEDIKFHGLISRSFRAPTFNDLYWSTPGMVGNPNLNPEKGLTGEIGVEAKLNKKILSGITYYRSKYDDLIQWAPLTDDPSSDWSVKNIGSATIDGIELTNKISLTDNLEADLNYTYMIAKDAKTHKFLIYQPQDKVDFCVKYRDLKGLLIELKGQFTGRRFTSEDNTASVKQFFVFGISVSKKIGSHFTYFAYIDNLLNRQYQVQSGYPMPGFSFTGGLKAEF